MTLLADVAALIASLNSPRVKWSLAAKEVTLDGETVAKVAPYAGRPDEGCLFLLRASGWSDRWGIVVRSFGPEVTDRLDALRAYVQWRLNQPDAPRLPSKNKTEAL